MAAKKNEPTYAQLNAQIEALQAKAAEVRRKEVAEVITKIKSAVQHYGLTAEDLGLAVKSAKSPKGPAAGSTLKKSNARPSKPSGAKKPTKPIKYQDGTGNTWVGHGKRPKWFVDALTAGKTAEDLLVKAA